MQTPLKKNFIKLITTKAIHLEFLYDISVNESEVKNFSIDLDFQPVFSDSDKTSFDILFKLHITDENKVCDIKCAYIGCFRTKLPIDDDFKKDDLINVNAPAIVYPFLRSYISFFSVNSGFPPIVLPIINLYQLHKKKMERANKTARKD